MKISVPGTPTESGHSQDLEPQQRYELALAFKANGQEKKVIQLLEYLVKVEEK